MTLKKCQNNPKTPTPKPMRNLFSSGSKYQKFARQNNCNLVESNGYWLLYQDGQLVARDKDPQDAIQLLTTRK